MGCRNLLSGPNSNHRLETTVYKPLDGGRNREIVIAESLARAIAAI